MARRSGSGAGDDGFVALAVGSGRQPSRYCIGDGREWFDGDALHRDSGRSAPLAGDWVTSATTIQDPPVEIPIQFSSNGLAWSQVASVADRDTERTSDTPVNSFPLAGPCFSAPHVSPVVLLFRAGCGLQSTGIRGS